MEKEELFKQYQRCFADLISLTLSENNSQNDIAQEERNTVAQLENEYIQITTDLKKAKQAIDYQYHSIWESCVNNAGLKRPEAQRPVYTDKNWRACVKNQELAAKVIRDWFSEKKKQAVLERQRQLEQEAAKRAARALSTAEAERKRKEEAAALEEARAASLLEEMKRKYRQN